MNRVLRSILAGLLACCGLATFAVPSAQAADLDMDTGRRVDSAAYAQEQLFVVLEGAPYRYTPGAEGLDALTLVDERAQGDGAARLSALEADMRLFAHEGDLFALSLGEQPMVHPLEQVNDRLLLGDGSSVEAGPLHTLEGYPQPPLQTLAAGGRVYVLQQAMRGDDMALNLWSYDLEHGGPATLHSAKHLWALCPYKDGTLLALQMDYAQRWDPVTKRVYNSKLCVYDPQADTLRTMANSGVPFHAVGLGLAYDAERDAIYMRSKQQVYLHAGPARAQPVARLGAPGNERQENVGLFVLPGGDLLAVSGQRIVTRSPEPHTAPQGQLSVLGATEMDQTHQATVRDIDFPVRFLSQRLVSTAQELAQALIAGEEDIDLISLRSNYIDIHQLMDKGYAADLSGSQPLEQYVSTLYPDMQALARPQGRLLMVPVRVDTGCALGYNTAAYKRLDGMPLPGTYDELVDLLERWGQARGGQHPDIVPFEGGDLREHMARLALTLCKDRAVVRGVPFSYQDPLLLGMLERALALDARAFSGGASTGTQALFSLSPWFDVRSLDTHLKAEQGLEAGLHMPDTGLVMPLMLSAAEGERPAARTTLTLMFVNPRSRHREQATAYLERYVSHITPEQRIMLSPAANAPVPGQDSAGERAQMDAHLAALTQAIQAAQGAEKTELERQYREAEKSYAALSDRAQYDISWDAIALYRQWVQGSYIDLSGYYAGLLGQEFDLLLGRLLAGQLTLEQYAQEAEGRLNLMRMEGE